MTIAREIEISVGIKNLDAEIQVRSTHVRPVESSPPYVVTEFVTNWKKPTGLNSEYGHGISLVHDVKDHYLFGLGITPLTEMQTIVQTYVGRALVEGRPRDDAVNQIRTAIRDEMLGPRGPRVYGPLETGLLDLHCRSISLRHRELGVCHMDSLCLQIMLPRIVDVLSKNSDILLLQRSTRAQPELIDQLLPGLKWVCVRDRLLRLEDNIGYQRTVKAAPDPRLELMTERIRKDIDEYVAKNHLGKYSPIFSTKGYCFEEWRDSTV